LPVVVEGGTPNLDLTDRRPVFVLHRTALLDGFDRLTPRRWLAELGL
jgi:hypothetical protein